MKRLTIILSACAAVACVVLVLSRSQDTDEHSGPASGKEATTVNNTRNRSQRETDSSYPDHESSVTSALSSTKSPEEALADAVGRLQEPERSITISEILGSWAETDPLAALAWVAQSGPGRENADDLRAHLIFIWSGNQPEAAATWLEENPGMGQPANLLALLGPWMEVSPEAAVAWSTTKIELIQRESILADLLVSCRTTQNALALLGEVDPVVADNALQAAVTSLADEEPEFAGQLSALITAPVELPREKPQLDSAEPSQTAPSKE